MSNHHRLALITRCGGCGCWRHDLDNNPCTVCIQLQEQRQ